MNIDNVKVGDKFTTMNKLCKALEIELQRGAERKYQIADIDRYLKYEKTGKINRNNHKVSNVSNPGLITPPVRTTETVLPV